MCLLITCCSINKNTEHMHSVPECLVCTLGMEVGRFRRLIAVTSVEDMATTLQDETNNNLGSCIAQEIVQSSYYCNY